MHFHMVAALVRFRPNLPIFQSFRRLPWFSSSKRPYHLAGRRLYSPCWRLTFPSLSSEHELTLTNFPSCGHHWRLPSFQNPLSLTPQQRLLSSGTSSSSSSSFTSAPLSPHPLSCCLQLDAHHVCAAPPLQPRPSSLRPFSSACYRLNRPFW